MGPEHNTNFSTPPMDSQSHIFFQQNHDDVIKWKHIPRYWPFVQGIHWSPVNSPHKGQWCGALMFSLMCQNKRFSKQWRRWWFQMPLCSLWCHCNVLNAGAKMLKWISLFSQFCWSLSRISESHMRKLLPLIARFMGPTWGPSGADRTQVGLILAPWTIWIIFVTQNLHL